MSLSNGYVNVEKQKILSLDLNCLIKIKTIPIKVKIQMEKQMHQIETSKNLISYYDKLKTQLKHHILTFESHKQKDITTKKQRDQKSLENNKCLTIKKR